MQLTRLDRWLLERYVYETHVYTLSPPATLPAGVYERPLPPNPANRFNHLLIATNQQSADALIDSLKRNNQMFSTRVVDRNAWYTPIIAPAGRSFTWRVVWLLIFLAAAVLLIARLKSFVESPRIRELISELRK